MEMTPERWTRTTVYLNEVFGARTDEVGRALEGQPRRAERAGLPAIAISAEVGRLLALLTRAACHGPGATGFALEIGTLGGYSAVWIADALPADGRLVTIEMDPDHARFARTEFDRAGVGGRVEIVEGAALEVLPALAERFGRGGLDMVFLDAEKREYPAYLEIIKPLVRVGGFVIADNALGSGDWWIDCDPAELDDDARASRAGADMMNRTMVEDPAFETACVPSRDGVLIATRVRD